MIAMSTFFGVKEDGVISLLLLLRGDSSGESESSSAGIARFALAEIPFLLAASDWIRDLFPNMEFDSLW